MTDRMEAHNARAYTSSPSSRALSGVVDRRARNSGSTAGQRMARPVMSASVRAIGGTATRGLLYLSLTLVVMIGATAWLTDGFSKRPTWVWGHGFHSMHVSDPAKLR